MLDCRAEGREREREKEEGEGRSEKEKRYVIESRKCLNAFKDQSKLSSFLSRLKL